MISNIFKKLITFKLYYEIFNTITPKNKIYIYNKKFFSKNFYKFFYYMFYKNIIFKSNFRHNILFKSSNYFINNVNILNNKKNYFYNIINPKIIKKNHFFKKTIDLKNYFFKKIIFIENISFNFKIFTNSLLKHHFVNLNYVYIVNSTSLLYLNVFKKNSKLFFQNKNFISGVFSIILYDNFIKNNYKFKAKFNLFYYMFKKLNLKFEINLFNFFYFNTPINKNTMDFHSMSITNNSYKNNPKINLIRYFLFINDFYYNNLKNNKYNFLSNKYLTNINILYNGYFLNPFILPLFNYNNYLNYYNNYYPVFYINSKSVNTIINKFKDSYNSNFFSYTNQLILNFLEFFFKSRFYIKTINNVLITILFKNKVDTMFNIYRFFQPKYLKKYLISDFFELLWYSFFLKDMKLLSS